MKGIVLAGGSGTRLYPLTQAVSKQLLPVFDKPLIYYPLSVLMLAGIRDILIITTPHEAPLFENLLGSGSQWGLRLQYAEQPNPDGLAQGMIIAERFLDGSPSALILGDNIFYGNGLEKALSTFTQVTEGACIIAYAVQDPERYGVATFDDDGKVVEIVEKPARPSSSWAVTGLYFYDGRAPQLARTLKPSARGELEITDLNNCYLREGTLKAERLGRGFAWLDTGTHDTLFEASSFVRLIQHRTGLMISCPEEIAYAKGWIDGDAIKAAAKKLNKSAYGNYLLSLIER